MLHFTPLCIDVALGAVAAVCMDTYVGDERGVPEVLWAQQTREFPAGARTQVFLRPRTAPLGTRTICVRLCASLCELLKSMPLYPVMHACTACLCLWVLTSAAFL